MLDSTKSRTPLVGRGVEAVTVRPMPINLNLIPVEFRRRLVTRPRLLMATLILSAAFAYPYVYSAQLLVADRTDQLQQQLTILNSVSEAETKRIAKEKTEATRLDEEITRLKDEVALRSTRASVETQTLRRFDLAPGFELVLTNQHQGLEVISASWQEPNLTVQGWADDLPALMSYTDKLQQSGRFRRLRLRLLEEASSQAEAGAKPVTATPFQTPTRSTALRATRSLSFTVELELATDHKL